MAAFASFSGGAGTAGDPYIIATSADLKALAASVDSGETFSGKHFKLTKNIDLGGSAANQWTPIGAFVSSVDNKPFAGTFDGGGFTISGLYVNAASEDAQGLFGFISGDAAEIRNLTVSGEARGASAVGVVVGGNYGGTVTNCAASGTASGGGSDGGVGGIVGYNYVGTVTNCASSVNASGASAGCVVGTNGGTVKNCTANGDVSRSGTNTIVGGVVGYNYGGTVTNCASTCGTVSGSGTVSMVGGVVGGNYGGTVSCCTAGGNISGTAGTVGAVGGVVGYNYGGAVINCASTCGTVGGTGVFVGGVVGINGDNGTVSNCGWWKDTTRGVSADKHIGGDTGAVTDVASYDSTLAPKVAVTCLPETFILSGSGDSTLQFVTYPTSADASHIKSADLTVASTDIAAVSDTNASGKITITPKKLGSTTLSAAITFAPTWFKDELADTSADVTLDPQTVLNVTALNPTPKPDPDPKPSGGSSSGCSVGFAALALLAVIPVFTRRKKQS